MPFKTSNTKTLRGQALILILLSLTVVLTIVLFVLARSTTDIAVSSRSEEGIRAFSAAEAGIENSLVIGTGGSGTVGNANYTSSVTKFAEGVTSFNYPIDLAAGDSMPVWFVSHKDNGDIDVHFYTGDSMKLCWGKDGTQVNSTAPAIEISIFYETTPGDPATVRIGRAAIDPFGARNPGNNFTASDGSGCVIDGVNYAFQQTISFADLGVTTTGLVFARVRMLYNSTPQPLGVSVTGGVLPSQGQDISSTGTAGESNRKVKVFQGWQEAPSVLDFAIYSPSGLTK